MAKLKNDLKKAINKQVNEFLTDAKNVKRIETTIQNELQAGAREGKGYDGKDFPSISAKWSEKREYLIKKGYVKPRSKYGVGKSNLTFTGELLTKIKCKFSGIRKTSTKTVGVFELSGEGNHKAYSKKKKSGSLISDIIDGLTDRGWKFMGVYPKAKERIISQFKRFLRRGI